MTGYDRAGRDAGSHGFLRLGGACLALSLSFLTPLLPARPARAEASDEGSEPISSARAFRRGVKAEMREALGAEAVTHGDAIDAAYLRVGWQRGQPFTDEQTRSASRQAREWGFRLEEFARAAPKQRKFSRRELSAAPLDAESKAPAVELGVVTVGLAAAPKPEPAPAKPEALPSKVASAPTKSAPAPARATASPEHDARLAQAEQRAAALNEELAALTLRLESLEIEARLSADTSPESKARHRASIQALNGVLDTLLASLASLTAEISAMRSL